VIDDGVCTQRGTTQNKITHKVYVYFIHSENFG